MWFRWSAFTCQSCSYHLPKNASTGQKFAKICNTFLTHRRFSSQEAAYRRCGLPLKSCSTPVQFLDTRPINARSHLLLPKSKLRDVPGDETKLFVTSIFGKYAARPLTASFDIMPLLEFAKNYVTCNKQTNAIQLQHNFEFVRCQRNKLDLRSPTLTPRSPWG